MDTVEYETNHIVSSKMTATGPVCSAEAGKCDAEKKRMRILILRVTPNKVSTATYNLQEIGLAKALIRRGYSCDVAYYCGKEKDHEEWLHFDENKAVRIIWLHGYGFLREGIYPSLKQYIGNYDIIQVGGYVNFVSFWLYRHARDKVVNYQGPYFYEHNKTDRIKSLMFDHTILTPWQKKNMVVGTKSILATEYLKNKGIRDVTTIGVGLDVDNLSEQYRTITEKNEFVKRVSEQKKDKYLLYIGALEPRRNIMFLLEVFKKIIEKHPGYRLIIIGKGKEEYVKECFDYMDRMHLRDKILYQDKMEQKYLKDIYQVSDAFLLPTRYEIFGMVLLEAMYFGLPVFTTYNGGSSVLFDGNNGVIIREMSADVWCERILKVTEDDALCKSIGEAASGTISDHYTWDALSDKFIRLYQKKLRSSVNGKYNASH